MALDHSHVTLTEPGEPVAWTLDEALLYAVAVGAGRGEAADLRYVTENSTGVAPAVLPTFVNLLGGRVPPVGDIDYANFFHAGQGVEVTSPVPTSGRVVPVHRVDGIDDKGSGVLVRTSCRLEDAETGELVARTTSDFFLRGESGAAGDPAPAPTWVAPEGEADEVLTVETRPEQANLYRLTGDRNPLHSDPAFARTAGFERPILHGMCTFGMTGLALGRLLGAEPGAFSMSARFTRPVLPGATLAVHVWRGDGGSVRFRTLDEDGAVVLDRGELRTG